MARSNSTSRPFDQRAYLVAMGLVKPADPPSPGRLFEGVPLHHLRGVREKLLRILAEADSQIARLTAVKATASGGMGAVAPMAAKRSGAEASGVRTPDQPMGANANKGRIETGGGGLNGSNSRK